MKVFCVYDNGRKASREGQSGLTSDLWATHQFSTLTEAVEYARSYLGAMFGDVIPDNVAETDLPLKIDDYSGYGDTFEIRTEEA